MNLLKGWGKATVTFRDTIQYAPGVPLANVVVSDRVRIEGGCVHIVVKEEPSPTDVRVVSIPVDRVARVEWRISKSEF
ncbi:hypothetical protein [Streptomyces sp. NPDC050534]|uniref:hypothetical protein n=1 Tax=Streptomyces sp. NPDC050534 TaxID=3365625 RepID=UPI0037873CEA